MSNIQCVQNLEFRRCKSFLQIRAAVADGVTKGILLADAGYGNTSSFRDAFTELDLTYVVGVQGNILV